MCTKLCCIGVNKAELKLRVKRKRKAKFIRSFLGSWFNTNSSLEIRRDNLAPANQRWRVTGALWDKQTTFQAIGFIQSRGSQLKFTWQTLLLDDKIIHLNPDRVLITDSLVADNEMTFDQPILRCALNPSLQKELRFLFPNEITFFRNS